MGRFCLCQRTVVGRELPDGEKFSKSWAGSPQSTADSIGRKRNELILLWEDNADEVGVVLPITMVKLTV